MLMTLYEFNLMNDKDKLATVWELGVFLDNHISKIEMLSCYAIDMFFVELVYDVDTNKVTTIRSFKSGSCLDKYAPDIESYF